MENRHKIITKINNKRLEIDAKDAFMPLANYLRKNEALTGTKIVCAEGDCGACTVLIANEINSDGKLVFKTVNSCILPLYLADGAQIITVEGIKFSDQELHPVQQSMIKNQGAQCGYCTPGFICSITNLLENNINLQNNLTVKKTKNFLTGNLCRCTGYLPIIEAAINIDLQNTPLLKDRYHNPTWIKEMKSIKNNSLRMIFEDKDIILPTTIIDALTEKNKNPNIRIVGGGTDLGVHFNKGVSAVAHTMALNHISELKTITADQNYIHVGAQVTLSDFEEYIEDSIPELKNLLHIFASPQIKNQATIVGNVVNGSPIGDTIPFLMAIDAIVLLQSVNGFRELKMSEFYLGYKKIDIQMNELVTSIKIPRLRPNESLRLFKVSKRKDLDISAVTFAAIVELDKNKILRFRVALGGVGAVVLRLAAIENKLIGQDFNKQTFDQIKNELPLFISPLSDLRASKEYRLKVAQNFFLKFFSEVSSGEIA
jgi:xanthine dehydrogenase small subunit